MCANDLFRFSPALQCRHTCPTMLFLVHLSRTRSGLFCKPWSSARVALQSAYDYLRSVCGDVTVTQGDFDESSKWPDTQAGRGTVTFLLSGCGVAKSLERCRGQTHAAARCRQHAWGAMAELIACGWAMMGGFSALGRRCLSDLKTPGLPMPRRWCRSETSAWGCVMATRYASVGTGLLGARGSVSGSGACSLVASMHLARSLRSSPMSSCSLNMVVRCARPDRQLPSAVLLSLGRHASCPFLPCARWCLGETRMR